MNNVPLRFDVLEALGIETTRAYRLQELGRLTGCRIARFETDDINAGLQDVEATMKAIVAREWTP